MSDTTVCVCGHEDRYHQRSDGSCDAWIETHKYLGCLCKRFRVAETPDPVVRPSHYNWHPSGVECKDIVEHFSFWVGSAIQYQWRHLHKGNPIEDLKKARECLGNEIARLEKEQKK